MPFMPTKSSLWVPQLLFVWSLSYSRSVVVARVVRNGDSLTFDPPIPSFSFVDGLGCTDASKAKINGDVGISLLPVNDDGTAAFCATGISDYTRDGIGNRVEEYFKIDQIQCGDEGYDDRRSVCTDATCSDCTVSSFVFQDWTSVQLSLPEGLEGACFEATVAPDRTFDETGAVLNFRYAPEASLEDAAAMNEFLWEHSCIGERRSGFGINDASSETTTTGPEPSAGLTRDESSSPVLTTTPRTLSSLALVTGAMAMALFGHYY